MDDKTMNKNSLLMLLLGVVVGAIIAYAATATPKTEPVEPEFNIDAYGFRNITFIDDKVNIEIVKRIDADNVSVEKNVQMPLAGFLKGFGAMEQLIKQLVDEGIVDRNTGDNEPGGE